MPPRNSEILPAFFSIGDAAAFLGCSPRTVRRLLSAGLASYRLGERGHVRIRLADLENYLEKFRQEETLDALVVEILREFQ